MVFVSFTQHCIQSNVTHLTRVKRVKGVLCIKWSLAPPKYAVRAHSIFTHNFSNIQLIFNPEKVLGRCVSLVRCLFGGISDTRSLLGDTQEVSTRGVSTQVSEYQWGEYSPQTWELRGRVLNPHAPPPP